LVRRVITVSLETMKIVKTLPALNERVDDWNLRLQANTTVI
jgi:hypothetical protein